MSTALTAADILERIRHIQADTAGVMEASRWAEWVLSNRFKAEGTGIHSRVNAIQHLLPAELVADLRYLASVRNDFAHNPMAKVRQPERFTSTARRVLQHLLDMPVPAARPAPARAPAPPAGLQRMVFVASVAGFWAIAVIAYALVLEARRPDPAEPAAAEVEQELREASPGLSRPEASATAEHREPERSAPPARTRKADAAPQPAGTRTPAVAEARTPRKADASASVPVGPDDSGLSLEDLRKLKGTL